MYIRTLLLTILFSIHSILPSNLSGQGIIPAGNQDETTQLGSDSVVLQPFSSIGINKEFSATNRLIAESENKLLTPDTRTEFSSDVDTLSTEIGGFLQDSSITSFDKHGSRELDQISQRTQFFIDQIEALQDRHSKVSSEIESDLERLQINRQRYQLTLDQGKDDLTLEPVEESIGRSIEDIGTAMNLLQDDLVFILELQDKLSARKTELEDLSSRVKQQKVVLGETFLNRDMPGFFEDLANMRNTGLVQTHWQVFKSSFEADLDMLKSGYMRAVTIATLLMLALLSFLVWFKRNHAEFISKDHSELSKLHLTVMNSPGASAIFIMGLMIRLVLSDLPQTFYAINLLIMMLALVVLVIRIYGPVLRTWIIVLVAATSMNILYELTYHPGILLRILLMGLSFTGIWLFAWLHRKQLFSGLIKNSLVYKSLKVLIIVFIVMQFLSIIANLVGTFRLAEFFTLVPLQIAVLLIAIELATKLADTLLYLILSINYLQKLNVIREDFQIIYKKASWLIDFILLLVFISVGLRILRIKDLVFDWGDRVFSDGFTIGAIDISLGSILIFFFVIWLSIMLSRIVSNILDKDVFTRVETAKGIPGMVILLLKIALISGGFFLAAAASGMHLTNLSIVLGAFSVGIGFGLQNIFNNLVSGLILAFERPINVGDVVQLGELMGTVKSIGLRSSTVKSFDGAEVIVPNGNLISNEMINWTLSDSNRRMDLRVGVTYGTNPERVIAIMEEIANKHEEVRKEPAPKAYFLEFGDSSLNFRLLAWVVLDNRLLVESEILVQINKKLAEAGIEIPFPQRDLHIRSDATKEKPAHGKTGK